MSALEPVCAVDPKTCRHDAAIGNDPEFDSLTGCKSENSPACLSACLPVRPV